MIFNNYPLTKIYHNITLKIKKLTRIIFDKDNKIKQTPDKINPESILQLLNLQNMV